MINKLTSSFSTNFTSYDLIIQDGLLKNPGVMIPLIKQFGSRFAIITDDLVASYHARELFKLLSENGCSVFLFSFPPGESSKTRETKELLENQLLEAGLGRDTCVIAIGGGVVTDVGGFLAATFCRGIPLILIPTTLLAMSDAAIGGKTGVNVTFGKNLIGCIYQPGIILIDPKTLKTLPLREVKNGFVEMIKHALISKDEYFEFLESHAEKLLSLELPIIQESIVLSCKIKLEIVEEDEKETGKRRLLNLGHTIGHALERMANYSIPHGEAVAVGILVECHMALQLGKLDQYSFDKIFTILKKFKIPLRFPEGYTLDNFMDAMKLDKKSLEGCPRFVMLQKIGKPISFDSSFCTTVDEQIILNALDWIKHALCCHCGANL